MSRYGEGVCIDCGTTGERLLAPRFPHICSTCLFPAQSLTHVLLTQVQRSAAHSKDRPVRYITGRWV